MAPVAPPRHDEKEAADYTDLHREHIGVNLRNRWLFSGELGHAVSIG